MEDGERGTHKPHSTALAFSVQHYPFSHLFYNAQTKKGPAEADPFLEYSSPTREEE